MQATEKLFLQTVGRFVADRLKQWTAPLIERIEKIERGLADAGRVERTDLSATDIEHLVDAKVARAFSALLDRPVVVSGHINRDGDLFFNLSDGNHFSVGRVVGRDADTAAIVETLKQHTARILDDWPKPKDGLDGLSLDNFTAQLDGRELTLRLEDAAHSKESKVVLPFPLYGGVWRAGTFYRGDFVSHEGSTWIVIADETKARPGDADSGWQLAVKRGRDGRDGKPGAQGAPGAPGRDGRDLTQIAPDGKKW